VGLEEHQVRVERQVQVVLAVLMELQGLAELQVRQVRQVLVEQQVHQVLVALMGLQGLVGLRV